MLLILFFVFSSQASVWSKVSPSALGTSKEGGQCVTSRFCTICRSHRLALCLYIPTNFPTQIGRAETLENISFTFFSGLIPCPISVFTCTPYENGKHTACLPNWMTKLKIASISEEQLKAELKWTHGYWRQADLVRGLLGGRGSNTKESPRDLREPGRTDCSL